MLRLRSVMLAFVAIMTPSIALSATYNRGIWFERAGLLEKNIGPTISNLQSLHVDSVHIVISSLVTDMGLFARCKGRTSSLRDIHQCASKQYIFGFDKWLPGQGRATLPEFIDALRSHKMRIYLMIWPSPTKQYVESLYKLTDFVGRHPVEGIELEDEDNWGPTYLGGYETNNKAASAVFSFLRINLPKNTMVGVTTAPRNFTSGLFTNDVLVRDADFLSYQTYQNVCSRGGDHCNLTNLSGSYAAGIMQDRAWRLLDQLPLKPGAKIILGLPAYDQAVGWTGGEANMYKSLAHAVCDFEKNHHNFSMIEIAYWSHANVSSRLGDGAYARRFLMGCTASRVSLVCGKKEMDEQRSAANSCPAVFK